MVSRLMSAFSVLSLFFAVATTASAQDSLAWKFESGESLKYVVQQSTQMVMNADGYEKGVATVVSVVLTEKSYNYLNRTRKMIF